MPQAKITAIATWGAKPFPGMENMNPWTVALKYKGRRLTVPFYMGHGHGGRQPTAAEVLETLANDAETYENVEDVDEFAAEIGYSASEPDERRKAYRIYVGVERNTRKLRQFLDEDYEDALYTKGWLEAHT